MNGPPLTWETAEVFPNRSMAEIGVSALASAGIATRIIADDAQGVGLPLGLRGGAELQVPTEDMADAREILFGDNVIDDEQVQSSQPSPPPSEQMISMGASTAGIVIALVLVVALVMAFVVSVL